MSPSSVWSEEEIASKLQGYLEITPDLWNTIKYGSHVRYINKNNEFKTGGFVLKNPIELNKQKKSDITDKNTSDTSNTSSNTSSNASGNTNNASLLQSNFDKSSSNYITWFVPYNDIKKLYLNFI